MLHAPLPAADRSMPTPSIGRIAASDASASPEPEPRSTTHAASGSASAAARWTKASRTWRPTPDASNRRARVDSGGRVAGGERTSILRLQQVHIPTARHIVRVPATANEQRARPLEEQPTVTRLCTQAGEPAPIRDRTV